MNSQTVTYGRIDTWLKEHRRLVVCTVVRTQGSVPRRVGARMVVLPDGTTHGTVGGGLFEALVRDGALIAHSEGQSRVKNYDFREQGKSPDAFGAVCGGTAEIFFEVASVPEHLLIVGGGHCGQALARAASLLERFRITLADERPVEDILPESVTFVQVASDYAELLGLVDAATLVVLVSQGAVTDENALRQVVGLPSCYLGMMGSRKKVRTVFDHLRAEGLDEALLARVHAPIGLEIGAETPAEIAVSILAQIIAVTKGKS